MLLQRKRVLDEKIEQAKERARMMSTKLQKGVTEEEYFAMQVTVMSVIDHVSD